ncbi:MAG: prohibitin family protein [Deltaproteobacteria bacterium]|nr:prohibitin family protein [Deltaproteobacteria bacterium]
MSDVFEVNKKQLSQKGPFVITAIAVIVILLILVSSAFVTIGPGQRGVVFSRLGGIKDVVLGEGLHFKLPYFEFIIPIDVRIQKAQTDSSASSKDMQMVSSTIAVNYHVDPDRANIVYQEIGKDFKSRIIDPAVQEAVKAATAEFKAEELIVKREEVSQMIRDNLTARLKPFNILVDEFNIVDFTFSRGFNESIEAKQMAEQQALKAERDHDRIKVEAAQKITAAEAEAESQRIQSKTISAEILQLRAIEKWDGQFPQVVGGALPFIDIGEVKPRRK